MSAARSVDAVLDRDFLEIRARLLELAAALDRIDRACEPPGGAAPDRRLALIRKAIDALGVPEPDRAETVQQIFSLEYDSAWREKFGVGGRRSG